MTCYRISLKLPLLDHSLWSRQCVSFHQIVDKRFKNEVYGMNCEDSVPSSDRNQQQWTTPCDGLNSFRRPWQSATDFKVFVYCLAVIVKILGLKATPISWLSHVRRVMKVKDKVKWQKMQKTTDRQHSSLLQLDTKPWLLPRWNSEGIRRTTTFHPLKPIGSTKRLKQWLTR